MAKLDIKKTPVFLMIGTLKHHVDCIAPCVGKLLEKEYPQYDVLYCDQTQIKEVKDKLNEYNKETHQVIAFDVGFVDSNTKFQTLTKGIKPAVLINPKQKYRLGDVGIIINIKDIYSGSLKNQKKKLLRNDYDEKIHKRVDRVVVDTYIALKQLIKAYSIE